MPSTSGGTAGRLPSGPSDPGSDRLVAPAELARLLALVREDEPAFLRDLERLVNVDSGTYSPAGVDTIGQIVADVLADLGARVERHADPAGRLGATVVGRFDGDRDGPRVLLIGHLDTVFPDGTAAARPFRIDPDGTAHGPGVTDMKGGLLAGLHALRALARFRMDGDGGGAGGAADAAGRAPDGGGGGVAGSARLPFRGLTFVANPDEEIGSPVSTPIIERIAGGSDVCLVLECARANGDIVSSRKGNLTLRIVVRGRAAHAGVEPEKGRSAILAAATLTVSLHGLTGRWPGVTVNVGAVAGGTRPNVVAERAELEVDVRAVTRESLVAAEAAVRELAAAPSVADVAIEVIEEARHWPMEKLERSGRLVDLAVGVAAGLGFPLSDAATGGASDGNTTAGLGVATIDGLGPIGGLDHSPDEYLQAASIVPRTALLAGLLLAIARDPVVARWRSVVDREPDAGAPSASTPASAG